MDAFPIRSNHLAPPSACGFRAPSSSSQPHNGPRVTTNTIMSSNAATQYNRSADGDYKRSPSPPTRNPPSAYDNIVSSGYPPPEPKTSFIDIGRDVTVKPTGENYRRYFKQQLDTMTAPTANKFRLTKEVLERHDRSSHDHLGHHRGDDDGSIGSSLPSAPDAFTAEAQEASNTIDFDHFDKKRSAPGLVSSFSLLMPPRVITRDVKYTDQQTEAVLRKKNLPLLTDYQTWLTEEVDPLLSVSTVQHLLMVLDVDLSYL